MIDVLHPGHAELSQRFTHSGSQQMAFRADTPHDTSESKSEAQGAEESNLVQDIKAGYVDLNAVKGLEASGLLIDPSQLRVGPPTSAPRGSTRGKLPA